MRTAGLPNFRKLWGKLNTCTGLATDGTCTPKDVDLEKGQYIIRIQNNYDVSSFLGKKYFVLSTTNMLGGQNYFLAICYIVVGALCIVFAIIFFVAYIRKQKLQEAPVAGN